MSTFEGTLKERDKTHAAEMELERKKREELEALVVTMQQRDRDNYQQIQQRRSETVDRPSAEPLLTGSGHSVGSVEIIEGATTRNVGFKTVTADTLKNTQPFQQYEDTEMQDNSSIVDSKWQVRSGKQRYINDDSSDENQEFFMDDNGEMKLVVSNIYAKSYILSHFLAGWGVRFLGTTYSTPPQIYAPSCTQICIPPSQLEHPSDPPKIPKGYIRHSFYVTSESFSYPWYYGSYFASNSWRTGPTVRPPHTHTKYDIIDHTITYAGGPRHSRNRNSQEAHCSIKESEGRSNTKDEGAW